MPRVISLILGGGRGTRLFPLTKSRSKPAVPIAGKYRLIDIPVSNCIHCGADPDLRVDPVQLRQPAPAHLQHVQVRSVQRRLRRDSGCAADDGARVVVSGDGRRRPRNIPYFTESNYDLVLILSGDQLYRMDFQDMIRTHLENKAVVTIAALPVAEQEATACGIMRIQADGRVIDFEEKPKTPEKLDRVRTDPDWLERLGLKAAGRPYLASMGIYLFNRVAPGRPA